MAADVTAVKVLEAALAERGYREDPINKTKYSAEIDAVFGKVTLSNGVQTFRNSISRTNGMEWCAIFCAWSFWKATGELPPLPDGGFYTPSDVNAWRRQGRLVTSPEPGDFVYYTRNGLPYHVGLVAEVRGGRYSSIEGNTSPTTVVNPDGGGVFQFGPVNGVPGDAPDRAIATPGILFARPEYALPPTIEEDDMTLYVTNSEPRIHEGREFPAGAIIYAIDPFGKLRNVKPAEWRAATAKGAAPVPTPNNELDYQNAT
jgi:hypothetical protein